jgi:hypothetical protein
MILQGIEATYSYVFGTLNAYKIVIALWKYTAEFSKLIFHNSNKSYIDVTVVKLIIFLKEAYQLFICGFKIN